MGPGCLFIPDNPRGGRTAPDKLAIGHFVRKGLYIHSQYLVLAPDNWPSMPLAKIFIDAGDCEHATARRRHEYLISLHELG